MKVPNIRLFTPMGTAQLTVKFRSV